jgi:hypothetical protein
VRRDFLAVSGSRVQETNSKTDAARAALIRFFKT